MLAQKTPIWKYSISWKVSEVIHKEIGVDYDFLKYDKHIFSISSGFRWHNLEKSLRYDGTKTNFFVATNKYHHDYIKTNKTSDHKQNTLRDTKYFSDTKSLTRLGTFAPEFSIPIGFSYLRRVGQELNRFNVWIKMESILFFHKGYRYDSKAFIVNNYGYSPEHFAVISKYRENVSAKKAITSNIDFALGVLFRFDIFEDYFVGLNSKVQFMPKQNYNPSNYHGLQRLNTRFVVSLGRYFNQQSHTEVAK